MKKRGLALILVVIMCTVVLSGCGGPESTYNAAQKLMANGDYVGAAEKFESIGSYEDATSLAMYCKAVAMGESGNYADAIAAFESFGEYKDSGYMKLYYEALSLETAGDRINAIQQYNAIPLFRDSAARANSLIAEMYADGTNYAKEEDFANAWLTMYTLNRAKLAYKDSETLEKYYSLRGREMSASATDYDEFIELAEGYDELKYADCVSRANKIRKSVYDEGKAAFDDKNYDAAINAFTALGDYSVSELMLGKSVKYKEITTASTEELLSSIMDNYTNVVYSIIDTLKIYGEFDTFEDIKSFQLAWENIIESLNENLEILRIAVPEDGYTDVWNSICANIQALKDLCVPFTDLDVNDDGKYTSEEGDAIYNKNVSQIENVTLEGIEILTPYAR